MRRGSHAPSGSRGHGHIQPSTPPDDDFIAADASAEAASPPTRSFQSSYARMTRGRANAAPVVAPAMTSRAPASGTSAARRRDDDASSSPPKPPLPPTPPPSSSSLSIHAMTPPSTTASPTTTPMSSPDDAGVARHRRPGRRLPGASSSSLMQSPAAGTAIAVAPPAAPPTAIDLSAELFDASAPYVHVLHIPNAKVGLVIGRDGRHVSFVQARTGTRISIARDSWDGAKRRVEIEGSPNACALATEMIERLIDTSEDRSSGAGLDVGGGFLERVAASARAAAKVIEDDISRYGGSGDGKDGSLRDDDDGMVFGEDFDGRATAVTGRATGAPPTMSSASASPATATMTIPHTKVGMIIGRGGDNIKFIQQSTHARVQIQTDAETPEGAPNRIVYLRGTIQACRDAAKMINDQCVGRVMIHGGPGMDIPSSIQSPPPSLPATKMSAAPVAPPSMYVDPTTYVPTMSAPYFGQPYTGLYNPPPVAEHHHAHAAAAHAAMMMHHHHQHPYAAYWNSYMEYCQRAAYGGVGTYGYDAADAPTYYEASGSGGGAVEQPRLQQDTTKMTTTTTTTNATTAPAATEDQDADADAVDATRADDAERAASPKL